TDATLADPYLKLDLNVTGRMNAWNSSFEFPGWIDIFGPSAALTLNDSVIEANPAAGSTQYQALGPTIVADTSYAAALSVRAGAQLVLLNSSSTDTYADDTLTNGMPGPVPLSDTTAFQLNPTTGRTLGSFETPTDSLSLLEDWLYPDGVLSGALSVSFAPHPATPATQVSVTYNGSVFPLGAMDFPSGLASQALISLSPALITAIDSGGMLNYLNLTGSFPDSGASRISVTFGAATTGSVNISMVQVILYPLLDYNLFAADPNSRVTGIDSTIWLTWNSLPSSPVSQAPPYPWDSNKLLLLNGATARLANLIVPSPYPGPSATSAILPDSTSNAYLFRWAAFPVVGHGNIPVAGARVSAFYATSGGTNGTVNALNNLSGSGSILWGYVQYWDASHGIPSYGVTSAGGPEAGVGYLLLASDNLTQAALPSGIFLGSYNIEIAPPIPNVTTQSFAFSLTPYPGGLANGSADRALTTSFPQYTAELSIGTISFTVDGSPSGAEVHIGQTIGVEVPLVNSGTAPIDSIGASLTYVPNGGGGIRVALIPYMNASVPANGSYSIGLFWNVSESVVGDAGTISTMLFILVGWNGGLGVGDGGLTGNFTAIRILPSYVQIATFRTYPAQLRPDTSYTRNGTIAFNGTGLANIALIAHPLAGGPALQLAITNSSPGPFTLTFNSSALRTGVLYSFLLSATYNTASAPVRELPGNFSLVAATAELVIVVLLITANGVDPASSARIGQVLGVDVELLNEGTAPTANLSAGLLYVAPPPGPSTSIATQPLVNVSLPPGETYWVNFSWTVQESIVGEVGSISASLLAAFTWNGGLVPSGGGSVDGTAPIQIQPSQVRIVTFEPYPSSLQADSSYSSGGTISFNGSGRALIELVATPTGNGSSFVLAETNASAGAFNLTFSSARLLAGTVYVLSLQATYNTASAPVYGLAGTFSLAGGSSATSAAIPWIYVAIGAAVVVAIFLLLLVLRRRREEPARECGECGTLLSAGEETCPRCGAWFEVAPAPCPSCDAAIPVEATSCPACGTAAPDRVPPVPASEADRRAYEEFVGHYRAAAAGELGEDYPESDFWAWWKKQPSYYSF
ncbi:MAG: zinc ribbon domain-containing protein, partial [Thermoplasmata archaeon]